MLKEALVVIISFFKRYKTKEMLNVNTTRQRWTGASSMVT